MRRVSHAPPVRDFKPCGIPRRALREVYLPAEGLEAMRLSDLEGLDQAEAAQRMGVSRQTFGRILAAGRRVVTEALAEGLALRIKDAQAPGPSFETPLAKQEDGMPSEEKMMMLAITTNGTGLDDAVDPRFGRADGFLVVDPQTLTAKHVANPARDAQQGAGIAAAEIIARAGATVLLTGVVGPKAQQALEAAGVKVCQNFDGMTVREAVERYLAEGKAAQPGGADAK